MYHHFQHRCSDTKTQGVSLVGGPAYLCQYARCAAAACCCHVLAAMLACCSVLAVSVVFCLLFVSQGCGVSCHLEVLLLATRSAGVQVRRRTACPVGCGWHQPTSHCAFPLNFCLISGNDAGRLMMGQPSRLCFLYARAGAPKATLFWSLVQSTCSYVQPLDQYSGLCQLCLLLLLLLLH
jgi:hypothetical protein